MIASKELTILEIFKEDTSAALQKKLINLPADVAAHCLSHMYCAGIPTPYGVQSFTSRRFQPVFACLLPFPHQSLV